MAEMHKMVHMHRKHERERAEMRARHRADHASMDARHEKERHEMHQRHEADIVSQEGEPAVNSAVPSAQAGPAQQMPVAGAGV